MQYRRDADGNWTQHNLPTLDVVPFSKVDLSALPMSLRGRLVDETFERLNRSLHLEHGPLFHVCLLSRGQHQGGRLLLIVHHIVMDIVSWAPLLEDLMLAYRQLADGHEPRLPMKTTSFKKWAQTLVDYASSPGALAEVPYWTGCGDRPPLPMDFPDSDHSLASTRSEFTELEPNATQKLIEIVAPRLETQLSHLLLAVVAVGLSRWSGNTRVQIKVEGQGREAVGDNLNLSRTVGWFTSFYPVCFTIDNSQPLHGRIAAAIDDIKSIPSRGISYAALRYLNEDEAIRRKMLAIPEPEIAFNFAGQSGGTESAAHTSDDDQTAWGRLAETGKIQLAETDRGTRRHLIEIGAGIVKGRLLFRFGYGGGRFNHENVQRLSDVVRQDLERIIASFATE
jgi:non-ribosomal peptide synthase protein (TIGR01720 family)